MKLKPFLILLIPFLVSDFHAFAAEDAPSIPTERKVLVLPVEFKNLSFTYEAEDLRALLSQRGYSRGGAAGCVEEYFDAQLGDSLHVRFTVAPKVTLLHDYAYYSVNTLSGKPVRRAEAVKEACLSSDQAVDFSIFDNIVIFYAGGSPADGCASREHLSPHSWTLSEAGISLSLDGVPINLYSMCPELMAGSDRQAAFTGPGFLCHEYSHQLGLLDLYDTDGADSGGKGSALMRTTSIMDEGMFNLYGALPPNYNAIEREMLGIAKILPLTVGAHTLRPVNEDNAVYRLDAGVEGEYFLFECRDDKGWDAGIGMNGLMVYHVDKSSNDSGCGLTAAERWKPSENKVNANIKHQCAYLIRPGESFSYSSDPPLLPWSEKALPVALSSIKRNADGSVSFEVCAPLNIDRADVFQDAVILQWRGSVEDGEKTLLEWEDGEGNLKKIECSPYESGCFACVVEGLMSGERYKFSVSREGGKDRTSIDVTTLFYGGYPFIRVPDVGRNPDGSYSAGAAFPLRVMNAVDVAGVEWYLDSTPVSVGPDGYFHLQSSAELKAVVRYNDGTDETLVKCLKVK